MCLIAMELKHSARRYKVSAKVILLLQYVFRISIFLNALKAWYAYWTFFKLNLPIRYVFSYTCKIFQIISASYINQRKVREYELFMETQTVSTSNYKLCLLKDKLLRATLLLGYCLYASLYFMRMLTLYVPSLL